MPDTHTEYFGLASGMVSVLAFMPYLGSIFKGQTRPSAASWWTWMLLTLVTVISSSYAGASLSVLILPTWLCFAQITIAILSLRYGDRTWDGLNKVCVASAGLGLVLWIIAGQPLFALFASIIADIFATIPTFRHAWSKPLEENRLGWTMGWVSGILLMFAVKEWSLAESGWAIYFLSCMTVIVLLVWRPVLSRLFGLRA